MNCTRMNRNTEQKLNIRYVAQQEALRKISDMFDLVMFLPDYHAQDGDANTVLFYTKSAAAYNAALDAEEAAGVYVPSERYAMYVFAFENTNVNGQFSLDFANHGSIDLRGDFTLAIEEALFDVWKEHVSDGASVKKYIALTEARATRNAEFCTSAKCGSNDDRSWKSWDNAELFIGVFEGTERVAAAKAARFSSVPVENIRLIPV